MPLFTGLSGWGTLLRFPTYSPYIPPFSVLASLGVIHQVGNLWGILEKVPHLSIPLYIGISDDLWGMGEIMNELLSDASVGQLVLR